MTGAKPFGRGEKMKANRKAASQFHNYLAQKDVTAWWHSLHEEGGAGSDIEAVLAAEVSGKLHELQLAAPFESDETAVVFTALEWDTRRKHHKMLIGIVVPSGNGQTIGWHCRVPPRELMRGLHQTLSEWFLHWLAVRELMLEEE